MTTEIFASKTVNRIANLLTEQTPLITRRQLQRFLQSESTDDKSINQAMQIMYANDLIRREVRNVPPIKASLRSPDLPLWQSGWGKPSIDETVEMVAYVKAFNALAFVPTSVIVPTNLLLGLYGRSTMVQPSIHSLPAVIRANEFLMRYMKDSILARTTWKPATHVVQISLASIAVGGTCVINGGTEPTLLLALKPLRTGELTKLIESLTIAEVNYELY